MFGDHNRGDDGEVNLPVTVTIERNEHYVPSVAEPTGDPIEYLIADALAEDKISSGDDEESIVVIGEDFGEDIDVCGDNQDVYKVAFGEDIDFSGEDVYFDAIGEREMSDEECDDVCNEGLEWHYEFGPAYPSGGDHSPPRHANCANATC